MLNKKQICYEIQGYLWMFLGCIAYATSTSLFLADNGIIAGGVTGLAVLINYLNHNIPIGIISIVINLPILLLGIKLQGWKFVIRCYAKIPLYEYYLQKIIKQSNRNGDDNN